MYHGYISSIFHHKLPGLRVDRNVRQQ